MSSTSASEHIVEDPSFSTALTSSVFATVSHEQIVGGNQPTPLILENLSEEEFSPNDPSSFTLTELVINEEMTTTTSQISVAYETDLLFVRNLFV